MRLSGDESSIFGDYGESWLRVCAAGCGLLHGNPDTRDLVKSDVSVTYPGELVGVWHRTVWVQVKATQNARDLSDGGLSFDLDVETYNVLRRSNSHVRRLLVVVKVSDLNSKIVVEPAATRLLGRAHWVSLEGEPETRNTTTVAVTLPGANRVDQDGLLRMLKTYGARSSSIVPDVTGWEEGR